MSAFERLGELEATVKNLPILEREAFENEILRLIGEDAEPNKWKTAYDKSPGRMPLVTEYANNAYMRKLRDEGPPDIDPETQALRDRWERPASSRSPSTRGAAFQDPSEERLSDGNAFLAARRREELGHGTEPSAPPSPTLSASDRDVEPLSPGEVSPVLGPVGLALINDPSLPYRPSPRSGATETAATKAVRSDSDGHARPMGRR
ncbi:hypothetical protein [Streptomyces sp. NPDC088350]|uniref:hypothetical protein n=1 Tax=Streptomyces sp. NPDC088350 TaxID=3365854 RepID=UPI0037FCFCA6